MSKSFRALALTLCLCLFSSLLPGCGTQADAPMPTPAPAVYEQDYNEPVIYQSGTDGGQTTAGESWLDPDGTYSEYEDVALYLHTYGELPGNYITKAEARDLGWSGGSVERYAPGKCIGGDTFGNYEGILPTGRYHECDVGTLGETSRGAQRIIWDENGNIYYTNDHYESFELLYPAP